MSMAITLTNDLLKGVMTDALVNRGYVSDVSLCTTPGVYYSDINTQGWDVTLSSKYGTLIVFYTGMGIIQVYFTVYSPTAFFFRVHGDSSQEGWKSWIKVSGATV